MKLRICILLLLLIIIASCSESYNSNQQSVEVIVPIERDTCVKQLQNIKEIQIIPLDNNPKCQITRLSKMAVTQNNILILDITNGAKLMSFTSDGKFVKNIGEKGRSKSEVTFIQDFCTNEKGDSVFLLDWTNVKVFDNNGNYLKTYELEDSVHYRYIERDVTGFWCVSNYNGTSHLLHHRNQNFELDGQFVSTGGQDFDECPFLRYPIWKSHGKTIFCDFFSSSFYIFEQNIQTCCRIESENIISTNKLNDKMWQDECDYVEKFWYDGKYIYGMMCYDDYLEKFRIDEENEKCVIYDVFDFDPSVDCYFDGYYYSLVEPIQILRFIEMPDNVLSDSERKVVNAMSGLKEKITEDNNFVIVKIKK